MYIANDVGTAKNEDLVAVFFAPVVVERGVVLVDVGPHRPVVNDDAFAHGLEEVGHQVVASNLDYPLTKIKPGWSRASSPALGRWPKPMNSRIWPTTNDGFHTQTPAPYADRRYKLAQTIELLLSFNNHSRVHSKRSFNYQITKLPDYQISSFSWSNFGRRSATYLGGIEYWICSQMCRPRRQQLLFAID